MGYAIIKTDYYEGKETELERYFMSLTDSPLSEDIWVFEKMRQSAGHNANSYTVYFGEANQSIFKYFAINCFKIGNLVSTVKAKIGGCGHFVKFIGEKYPDITLQQVNRKLIADYKEYLIEYTRSKGTRELYFGALISFFHDMRGWPAVPSQPPLGRNNPFSRKNNDRKHDEKYVPEFVLNQYDIKFRDIRIPLHRRLIYWVARSIPSRISEVTGMSLECLKPYQNKWCLIMPTWKQNGGYLEPQLRRIYLKYSGHGKFLIDMIREQQEIARSLQSSLPDHQKGMLFTYPAKIKQHTKTGEVVFVPYSDKIYIANRSSVMRWLHDYSAEWNAVDENGATYILTSHQLRHNGITDRVWAGFNVVEIRDMTGHQGDAMIEASYTHVLPQEAIKIQNKVIESREGQNFRSKEAVMFRGRILNMDEQTESRILKNIRACRIGNLGICSDITGCKSSPFECLNCESFVPNADELDYFENQVYDWSQKVDKFSNHEFMRQNAEYNLELNKNIVAKIKRIMKEEK